MRKGQCLVVSPFKFWSMSVLMSLLLPRLGSRVDCHNDYRRLDYLALLSPTPAPYCFLSCWEAGRGKSSLHFFSEILSLVKWLAEAKFSVCWGPLSKMSLFCWGLAEAESSLGVCVLFGSWLRYTTIVYHPFLKFVPEACRGKILTVYLWALNP